MKLFSAPVLGCGMFFMVLAMDVKCDKKDILGGSLLDGLWFAAAVSDSNSGDADLQDQIDDLNGQIDDLSGRVTPGADGVSCWDLNGNGVADANEDVNGDGVWDAQDCQGADGTDGTDGTDGKDGANCWDTIGDYNEDGATDGQDCLDWVADHSTPTDGANCYDTIGDYNEDGVTDGDDCLDWVADNTETGADSSIIARGYIDNFGVTESNINILSVDVVATGQYIIVVNLADADLDLTSEMLQPFDFPVLLTVYATFADTSPTSTDMAALVGHYTFGEGALNRDIGTLTLTVHILDAQSGEHTGANFSIAVLRP